MRWNEPVDFYCERLGPGFGAEPLNAITGLGFLVAGLIALRHARTRSDQFAALALAGVGIASTLHHSAAQVWSWQTDVWANRLYLVALGAVAARRLRGSGVAAALVIGLAFAAALEALPSLRLVRILLGPASDPFTLLCLLTLLVALSQRHRRPATARGLAAAALVLAAGLPFRFGDAAVCNAFPAGSHFAWHLFNALAAGLMLITLARHRRSAHPVRRGN